MLLPQFKCCLHDIGLISLALILSLLCFQCPLVWLINNNYYNIYIRDLKSPTYIRDLRSPCRSITYFSDPSDLQISSLGLYQRPQISRSITYFSDPSDLQISSLGLYQRPQISRSITYFSDPSDLQISSLGLYKRPRISRISSLYEQTFSLYYLHNK